MSQEEQKDKNITAEHLLSLMQDAMGSTTQACIESVLYKESSTGKQMHIVECIAGSMARLWNIHFVLLTASLTQVRNNAIDADKLAVSQSLLKALSLCCTEMLLNISKSAAEDSDTEDGKIAGQMLVDMYSSFVDSLSKAYPSVDMAPPVEDKTPADKSSMEEQMSETLELLNKALS